MKKIIFLLLLTFPNLVMAGETARYQVIEKISDDIEIRQYDNMMLATIATGADEEGNQNFRTLFKFISGENKKEQDISMTTPVFKEKIDNKRTMSFSLKSFYISSSRYLINS